MTPNLLHPKSATNSDQCSNRWLMTQRTAEPRIGPRTIRSWSRNTVTHASDEIADEASPAEAITKYPKAVAAQQ
jgi:hypothetical protein